MIIGQPVKKGLKSCAASVWRSQEDEKLCQSRQKSPAKCLQHSVSVVVSGPSMSASARLTLKQSAWSSQHCSRLGHCSLRIFLTFLMSLRLG